MGLAKSIATVAAAALSLAALTGFGPTPATAHSAPTDEPVPGYHLMGPPPAGANDWSCTPSPAHPRPVVLVHGTGSSMQRSYSLLSPLLKEQGYCVFALNYGGIPTWFDPSLIVWGVADMHDSARELARFVDAVLDHTGATQVDLVGHSQGGTMSRQYLKFEGGTNPTDPNLNKVASLVSLGPTNHGTTFNGQQQLAGILARMGLPAEVIGWAAFGVAGQQQLVGSGLIRQLNSGTETQPGVQYTVIATKHDEVVTPPASAFLNTANGNVTNLWVQDGCDTQTNHSGLLTDARPLWLVMTALDPDYATTHPAPCP